MPTVEAKGVRSRTGDGKPEAVVTRWKSPSRRAVASARDAEPSVCHRAVAVARVPHADNRPHEVEAAVNTVRSTLPPPTQLAYYTGLGLLAVSRSWSGR